MADLAAGARVTVSVEVTNTSERDGDEVVLVDVPADELLAGDIVVGAGNIYACEALFRAGIDPRLPAGKLSRPRAARLLAEVKAVLAEAIEQGGSSLRDFRDAHGSQGHFQLATQVYGREGQACRTCGGVVRRIVQAQRSTFFCGTCQRR